MPAPDVQTFWPLIDQPPSIGVAVVVTLARSDPASGSDSSWHQLSSPRTIGGRCAARCSSVPKTVRTGGTMSSAIASIFVEMP